MALLRAGKKVTPLRALIAKIFDTLARYGVSGTSGFEGDELAAKISERLESEFHREFAIPEYETVYVYRGDMSVDEFVYMIADALRGKVSDARTDEFYVALKDALSAHIFRPHLEVSHLYAR